MPIISVALLASLFAAAPSTPTPDAGRSDAQAKLTAAMRLNFAALMTLQPYLSSPERFADPANAPTVRDQLDILQRTPHAVSDLRTKSEPGLAAVAHLFKQYLDNVRWRFDHGQTEMARGQLRTASDFCFSCHTRVGVPADFPDQEQQLKKLALTPLEEANLAAATRQFDVALEGYRRYLSEPVKGEARSYAWLTAARSALRITVRAKNDPQATEKLIAGLEGRAGLPPYLKDYVAAWRRDLDIWKADPFDPAKASPAALVDKAREVIVHVDGWLADELPDIPLSRATRYLHEALTREPQGKHRPEALFLLGLASTGPFDPFLWDLGHLYLEACVRENPRTQVARRCFNHLQNDVYFGYTGSSGTHLPLDEQTRLSELRRLAY